MLSIRMKQAVVVAVSSPAEKVQRAEATQALLRELHRLPKRQKAVLLARFFEGKNYKRIAAEDGVSVSAAHARAKAAIERLRSPQVLARLREDCAPLLGAQ